MNIGSKNASWIVCHIIIASLIFKDLYLYEGLVDDNFKQICYMPTFPQVWMRSNKQDGTGNAGKAKASFIKRWCFGAGRGGWWGLFWRANILHILKVSLILQKREAQSPLGRMVTTNPSQTQPLGRRNIPSGNSLVLAHFPLLSHRRASQGSEVNGNESKRNERKGK